VLSIEAANAAYVPAAVPVGAVVTLPPLAAVYQTMLSPAPGVALPVCATPSKQTVTPAPVGVEGRGLIVTLAVVLLQVVVPSVNVKVTLPVAIPVTNPALVTVALVRSLLTHVPPDAGDKVIVLPTHKFAEGALTTGCALMVVDVVVCYSLSFHR